MPTQAEQRRSEEQRERELKNRAEGMTPGMLKAELTRRRKAVERARAGAARARENAERAAVARARPT